MDHGSSLHRASSIALMLLVTGPAAATVIEAGSVAYRHDASLLASDAPALDVPMTPSLEDGRSARDRAFGTRDTTEFVVYGQYGYDFSDAHQGGGGVGVSHFIAEGLSIDLELLGWGFSQPGSNAAGVNLNLIFRWHFHREDRWSLYGDAGAGLLLTTSDVPDDGSSFNITPQVGGGASFELTPTVRLMVGVRWHHISNGRSSSNNPGRDSLLLYAGLSIPLR